MTFDFNCRFYPKVSYILPCKNRKSVNVLRLSVYGRKKDDEEGCGGEVIKIPYVPLLTTNHLSILFGRWFFVYALFLPCSSPNLNISCRNLHITDPKGI